MSLKKEKGDSQGRTICLHDIELKYVRRIRKYEPKQNKKKKKLSTRERLSRVR